jgi:hypothetical protein
VKSALAIALTLGGCSIINDFSIGDGGLDGGEPSDAWSQVPDSGGDARDAGEVNACFEGQDRAALERTDFRVGMLSDLSYGDALLACFGTVECSPPSSLPVEELRACVDECLVLTADTTPVGERCRVCFLSLLDCIAGDPCVNECNYDRERCAPGQKDECLCERCLCDGGCIAQLVGCSGVPTDVCEF